MHSKVRFTVCLSGLSQFGHCLAKTKNRFKFLLHMLLDQSEMPTCSFLEFEFPIGVFLVEAGLLELITLYF